MQHGIHAPFLLQQKTNISPHKRVCFRRSKEAKRQRKDTLQDHSKPGTRWSSMTEHDHAWYLQNKGAALMLYWNAAPRCPACPWQPSQTRSAASAAAAAA
jgi:hypothetical protein